MKKRIASLVAFCLLMIPLITAPVFASGGDDTVLHVNATADMTIGNDIKSTKPTTNSELITVREYTWYKGNNIRDLGNIEDGESFAENTKYVLVAVFTVPEGYTINYGAYKFDDTVNGVLASYSQISENNRTLTGYYIVKTAEALSDFQVSVQEPVIGDTPSTPIIEPDGWNARPYTIDSYTWFCESADGIKNKMDEGQKFETGFKYTLSVVLSTDSTKCLVAEGASGTLNSEIKSKQSYKTDDTHINLDFELGEIEILRIQNADITVKEPVAGEMFDYTPTVTTNPLDSTSYNVVWYEYDSNNYKYTKITDKAQKAEADKYYFFDITLTPKEGYVINDTLVESVNGIMTDDNDYYNKIKENADGSVTITREYTTFVAYEIPFSVKVEQGESVVPVGEHTFELNIDINDYVLEVPHIEASVTTNGTGTFNGMIKLYGDPELINEMLKNNGIYVSLKSGDEEEWTYSDTKFLVSREETDEGIEELCYYVVNFVENPNYPGYLILEKGEKTDKMEFVNIYTSNEKGDDSETPSVTPGSGSTNVNPSATPSTDTNGVIDSNEKNNSTLNDETAFITPDNSSTDVDSSSTLDADSKSVSVVGEKIKNPKTADVTPYTVWVAMFSVSVVVLVSIITSKKRNNS